MKEFLFAVSGISAFLLLIFCVGTGGSSKVIYNKPPTTPKPDTVPPARPSSKKINIKEMADNLNKAYEISKDLDKHTTRIK